MNTTYIKNLKTPIAVIGLGKSGQAALNLLYAVGFSPDQIITFDEKKPASTCTNYEDLLLLQPQTLVVSPGVPISNDCLQKMLARGAHLTSEITLAASLLTIEKLIGVTGSVGKSTIVSLLGAGATSFDKNVFVGGNLGIPFCNYALGVLQGKPRAQWVILELSSYQLENCEQLSLDYSIISYLSPNHLERYKNLNDYYQSKLKITSLTKNICLFNKTSRDCVLYAEQSKSKAKLINADTFENKNILSHLFLIGAHNQDNFSLAAEMANLCCWPENSIPEMLRYRGLAHRLEFVVEMSGVTFVNDSKATAMDSVLVATSACLQYIKNSSHLFLLLGGKDKNLPWQELAALASNDKIIPVFFGACGLLAKERAGLEGEYFEKLGSAINYCQKRVHSGDFVLLSPGGTSLDEFNNFEERGDFFKSLVLSSFEA